jgi:lipopolysaccharide export system permease protein
MSKFDRYILSQCFSVYGFFTLVFVLLVWINRAVILFDELIGDGHSAWVFLEFSSLALPSVFAAVLPLSSFAATLYVTNRLSNESELAVMQATGFSPWRLARPFAYFGLLSALFLAVFTLFLAPLAGQKQTYRETELSSDLAAKLLKDGVFQHPADGVTLYIREILATGELKDTYISDRRDPKQSVTHTASTGYLLRQGDRNIVVLSDGQTQNYEKETETLSITQFADWTYDLGSDIFDNAPTKFAISKVPTSTILLTPKLAQQISNRPPAFVNEELHKRLHGPVLAFTTALVGFGAIFVAGFSRFGVGRYMLFGIFILVLMKMIESAVTGPTRTIYELWPLIYAPSIFGLACVCMMLLWTQRSRKIAPPIAETGAAS